MFVPMQGYDRALKIITKNAINGQKSNIKYRNNQQFIQEKEEFIRKVNKNNSANKNIHRQEHHKKQSFREETRRLLDEVKSLKGSKRKDR